MNLPAGSTTLINQNHATHFDGTLNNYGAFTLNHATGLASQYGGGTINNYGVFTVTQGNLSGQTFNNQASGVLVLQCGTGNQIQFNNAPFNNAGAVDLQSGELALWGGGTQTGVFHLSGPANTLHLYNMPWFYFNAGTTFTGDGLLDFSGNELQIAAPITIPNLYFGTGYMAAQPGGAVTVTRRFHWVQGTLQGVTLNLAPGAIGLADIDGYQTYLLGGTINNSGTFTLSHNEGIGSTGGYGTFNNYGTFMQQKGTFVGTFNNQTGGTLDIAPIGSSVTMYGPLNNAGTVNVVSGTLNFNDNFTQSGGQTILNHANLNRTSVAANFYLNGGTLQGNGWVIAPFYQAGGSIAPGNSTGALTIDGDYHQDAGGALDVELASAAQYDVLHVTGSASLGGRLNVNAINSYVPLTSTTFQVLTYGSRSGQFTAMNGLSITNRVVLTPQFNPTDLTLLTNELPKSDQTIAFGSLTDRVLGDPPFAITATASSGLVVTFTTSSSACTVTGITVTLVSGGPCAITAHQSGDVNYNAAPDVTRSFMVWRKVYLPLIIR